jgi:hypothetical protein
MTILFDRFAGAPGALSSHTADTMDTWMPSGTTMQLDGTGAAYSPAPTTPAYDIFAVSSWTPPGTDYGVEIVLGSGCRAGGNSGIVLRATCATVGNFDGYLVYLTPGSPDKLDIYHETKVSGTNTLVVQVGTQQTLGTNFGAGDTLTATIVGTSSPLITVYRNGTQIYQHADGDSAHITTAGRAGILINQNAVAATDVIRTFWAGPIAGPPALMITPSSAGVPFGATQPFAATNGLTGETFTASAVNGSFSGLTYTAPGSGTSDVVTITSVDLPLRTATAAITLGVTNVNNPFVHSMPSDFESAASGFPVADVPVGLGRGSAFPPLLNSAVVAAYRVPESVDLTTGLTFSFLLADDPLNPDPGHNVEMGVTIGPITPGTSTYDQDPVTGPLVSCTEILATVTLPNTAGVLTVASVAVPVSAMHSLAAGGWCMIRVRRLGLHPSDTHRHRVVLLGIDARNT